MTFHSGSVTKDTVEGRMWDRASQNILASHREDRTLAARDPTRASRKDSTSVDSSETMTRKFGRVELWRAYREEYTLRDIVPINLQVTLKVSGEDGRDIWMDSAKPQAEVEEA